ncbi:hypothetical protein TSAR_016574 [Trichomalopsis sarcophagae]|uniref:Uncharacterized protein n=1 Tax=Trichomalopsis sarcophagae TaxID=543379 RepID=A0A232EKU6_9HYME|nr:hypothetical protein TSAR_016574 [Trichomalopsis sarcophagae]
MSSVVSRVVLLMSSGRTSPPASCWTLRRLVNIPTTTRVTAGLAFECI